MGFVCTCAVGQRTTLGAALSCQIKLAISCGTRPFTWQVFQVLGLQRYIPSHQALSHFKKSLCGGQRTTLQESVSPSTIWVPEI